MKYHSNRKHVIDLMFPFALFFVFAASSLLVVLLAADIYQKTTVLAESNNQSRTALSYVTGKVHQGDAQGGVSIGRFDGHDSIIIRQTDGKQCYLTYIYEEEGMMRELFLQEGTKALAEDGREIMEIREFRMEQIQPELFRFSCRAENGTVLSTIVSVQSE